MILLDPLFIFIGRYFFLEPSHTTSLGEFFFDYFLIKNLRIKSVNPCLFSWLVIGFNAPWSSLFEIIFIRFKWLTFFTFQVRWNWNKTTLASLSDPHGMPSAHIKQVKCLRVQEGKCILIITASDKYGWREIGGRR